MTEFEKYFKDRFIAQERVIEKLQDQIKELVFNGEDLENHLELIHEFYDEATQILMIRNLWKKSIEIRCKKESN